MQSPLLTVLAEPTGQQPLNRSVIKFTQIPLLYYAVNKVTVWVVACMEVLFE
jgi:hypothetical protein